MSTLPILLPCSWSGRTLTLIGHFAVVSGPWVNPRHGRGPRYQVTALANRGTFIAAINYLEVKTSDIENSYLLAPATEKILCILGPDFGDDAGKKAIVVRALYGPKSAGAEFWNHLDDCMRHLGWES